MTENRNPKRYDLEERTLKFSQGVIGLTKTAPKSIANVEIMKQVVRSSGSVGANYIEANESLSKKDFAMRIKICRKEAKESRYWLQLLDVVGEVPQKSQGALINEASELMNIFGSILKKVE